MKIGCCRVTSNGYGKQKFVRFVSSIEQLTFVPTQTGAGGFVGLAFRAADEAGVGAELEVHAKVNVVT